MTHDHPEARDNAAFAEELERAAQRPQRPSQHSLLGSSSVFSALKADMADPEYAWSWHCNVAMAIYDTRDQGEMTVTHRLANEMAANVMRNLFEVDTRALTHWQQTAGNWS